MCEYPGRPQAGGSANHRALVLPRIPRLPGWLLRQPGPPALEALVDALYTGLETSPLGYRLPRADARSHLQQRARDELLAWAGQGLLDEDNTALLVGFRGAADTRTRLQWLCCLRAAMRHNKLPPLAEAALWRSLEPLSLRMVNFRIARTAQVRYPAWAMDQVDAP